MRSCSKTHIPADSATLTTENFPNSKQCTLTELNTQNQGIVYLLPSHAGVV